MALAGAPADAAAVSIAAAMRSASLARQVPLPLLQAVTYVNCRWEIVTTPSIDGGVGPMNIRPSQIAIASSLSGHDETLIKSDVAANIDAGAALLAHYHQRGAGLESWESAVATTEGSYVAVEVMNALRRGASRTTSTGESINLDPQQVTQMALAAAPASADYPSAQWIPASSANFTTADRPRDYPVDMIVIHDIEGSASSAIQVFQDPSRQASAHYVVSYAGQVTQMVLERDIAWHAGNWDYNTRSIGIEHEGFAYTPGLYTTAEYQASAHLIASICSRWGVPMDRSHVIGHYQVPDPFNPGLYGGADHHTDPGPYWNWTYYMSLAAGYASALPSPPHMVLKAFSVAGDGSATVSWQPARTCHLPLSGYRVVIQPGNVVQQLPATATSATFTGLQNGTTYAFTVTASNADGQDSLQSNPVVPGPACTAASITATPSSPQPISTVVHISAGSTTCTDPQFQFLIGSSGSWKVARPFGAATWDWDTTGLVAGTYTVRVWANHYTSDYSSPQASADASFTVTGCTSAALAPAPATYPTGTTITFTATAGGCPSPEFEFWGRASGGTWALVQPYSSNPAFVWQTAGAARGSYDAAVWVRQHGSGTPTYEVGTGGVYVLGGCVAANLSPASGSFEVGGTIMYTADSGGCPNARYEFWVRSTSGGWTMARGYSSSPTYVWNTAGLRPGAYQLAVWVRQLGSPSATYDAGAGGDYQLTGCATAGLAPPPGQLNRGSTIAFTATAAGCSTPEYEFWLRPAGGLWTIAQPYGPNSTFNWNTAGTTAATYDVAVWVREHGSGTPTYDAGTGGTYSLS
jgi:N-acetyl-anhydromuramyl-L-alanine amidase AmpD